MNKVISNYLYSVIYQLLILITPFVTTPYVSRVLGPEGIGIDAYVLSIVQMFSVFIVLSFPTYGSRQIARKQDLNETAKEFWSIYSIQIIVSIIILMSYTLLISSTTEYKTFFLIHFFTLAAAMFDVSWFFIGREEIKKVTTRNIIIKLVGICLIFTLVNDQDDLYIYILINSVVLLLGQLFMWVPLLKVISYEKVNFRNMKPHITPLLVLFLPQIMIQVYGNLSKIVLGVMSREVEVGFYNQAHKIIRICLGVITALSQVMLPRMSKEFAEGNEQTIQKYINYNLQFVLMITLPMTVGLAALAPNFTVWFLGEDFLPVVNIIILMSAVILFVGLANVFGIQILIATNQQNKYSISVTVGALMSICTNLLLVSSLGSLATTIALVVAEGTGAVIQMFYVRKYINTKLFLKWFFSYLVLSTFVYLTVSFIGTYADIPLILLIVSQVVSGMIVYCIGLIVIKDSIFVSVLKKLKKMLIK